VRGKTEQTLPETNIAPENRPSQKERPFLTLRNFTPSRWTSV